MKKLRKKPATFAEIAGYLDFESNLQEFDFNISKRTFDRDRNAIRSLFNIDIVWDKHRKVYFLDMEEQPEVNERILFFIDIPGRDALKFLVVLSVIIRIFHCISYFIQNICFVRVKFCGKRRWARLMN